MANFSQKYRGRGLPLVFCDPAIEVFDGAAAEIDHDRRIGAGEITRQREGEVFRGHHEGRAGPVAAVEMPRGIVLRLGLDQDAEHVHPVGGGARFVGIGPVRDDLRVFREQTQEIGGAGAAQSGDHQGAYAVVRRRCQRMAPGDGGQRDALAVREERGHVQLKEGRQLDGGEGHCKTAALPGHVEMLGHVGARLIQRRAAKKRAKTAHLHRGDVLFAQDPPLAAQDGAPGHWPGLRPVDAGTADQSCRQGSLLDAEDFNWGHP